SCGIPLSGVSIISENTVAASPSRLAGSLSSASIGATASMKNNKGFISLLLLDSNRNLGSVRNTISRNTIWQDRCQVGPCRPNGSCGVWAVSCGGRQTANLAVVVQKIPNLRFGVLSPL